MTDAVVAGWASAEDSLYAPLLADPHGYERVVNLVGGLIGYLRANVHDLAELVAASERGAALVAEVMPDAVLPWVPVEAALRAACAMRYREIRIDRERADRADRLREAAASGATWVRIVDPGSTLPARVAPSLLVHLASGMAIRCTTELDLDTGGARFVASPMMVDVTTGDVVGPLTQFGPPRSAESPEKREAEVTILQRLIGG